MCVIPGCVGLSSSDAWSWGSVGIFATSLGFARCFFKPSSISQVNFAIWRPFLSLEVILQPFQSLEIILMLKSDFAALKWVYGAAKWHSCAKKWFRSREIPCEMELWLRNWEFSRFGASQPFRSCKTPCEMELCLQKWDLSCFGGSQPFRSCEMGAPVLRSGTRVPKVVSQRGTWGYELISQQSADFVEATKSRRPLFLLCFRSVWLRKTSFQFLCISSWFWSSKNLYYIKTIRIKALKSKLKHLNQNLKH